jgi:hypothetical protein
MITRGSLVLLDASFVTILPECAGFTVPTPVGGSTVDRRYTFSQAR